METASDVIGDALRELIVLPAQVSMSQYHASVGIFYLNTMMDGLSTIGVNVGFTNVSSLGDEITVPDSAIEPIVKNLAIEVSPVFRDSLLSSDLFKQAVDGIDTLRSLSIDMPANAQYPSTLPFGSGNHGHFYTGDFCNRDGNEILTEIGGNIGPENAD